MNDYEGGFVLYDDNGSPAGSVDFVTNDGVTQLTVAVMGDVGASSTTVALPPDKVIDAAGGFKLAHRAAREFENKTLGVK